MSKYRFNPWSGAAIGLVIALVGLLVIGWATSHGERRILEAQQRRFCQRQAHALDTRMSSPDRIELRSAMVHRFTDPSAIDLCLGAARIDEQPAAVCWIKTGDGGCYLDLAKELRAMYRRAGF